MLDKGETFNYDLYKIDSKPKQTYAVFTTHLIPVEAYFGEDIYVNMPPLF